MTEVSQEAFIALLKFMGVDVLTVVKGERMYTNKAYSLFEIVEFVKDRVKHYSAAGSSGVTLTIGVDASLKRSYVAFFYIEANPRCNWCRVSNIERDLFIDSATSSGVNVFTDICGKTLKTFSNERLVPIIEHMKLHGQATVSGVELLTSINDLTERRVYHVIYFICENQ